MDRPPPSSRRSLGHGRAARAIDAPRSNVRLDAVAQRPEERTSRGRSDDAILAARRQAILFRQVVPPSHDPRHCSFFGGVPIAPPGFQWPGAIDARGGSTPISFLMQVDCGAIPAPAASSCCPNTVRSTSFSNRARTRSGCSTRPGPADGWAEIPPPETLGPIYEWRQAWKWPQSDGDVPRLWPKWPFDPVLVQGGPLPDDEEALAETYAWPGTVDVASAMRTIPGAIVPHRSFSEGAYGEGGKPRRPFDTYPQDWNAIRIATGLVAERTKHQVEGARRRTFKDMSDGEFAAMVDAVASERRHWDERASAAAPSDEVPQEDADGDAIRRWVPGD
jgi:hypothetical protein